MASETYDILYEVKGDALRAIDLLIAKVDQLDAAIARSKANMKGLGTGPIGGGIGQPGGQGGGSGFQVAAPSYMPRGAPKEAEASLSDMLPSLAAAAMGIRTVTQALDDMGEAAMKARKHMDQGAQAGLDKRGKAREYANLLQHEGPDDEVMARLFDLGKGGGFKFDDAVKYGEQFLGSSPAGVQAGHVTPDQLKKLEIEGARFANRIGLDPFTGGDLAGSIPQYTDLTKDANGNPLTTEQGVQKAMGQLGALQYGLNEGRGKISTLARSELGAAAPALAAGRIHDHAEMGAFVGIASTFTKTASSSGTAFKQMDDVINNSSLNYFEGIGVNAAKGDLEKLRALKKDIDARRAADPNFDVLGHLKEQGVSLRAARDSTAAFVQNFDILEKRAIEARKRAEHGQDVIDADQSYETSLEGQNQKADAMDEFGLYKQTEKHQRMTIARKFALGQLRQENKIDTSDENFNDWALDFVSGPTRKWSGELASRATGIDARVRENLVKSARSAGVDLEKKYPGFTRGYGEGVTWDIDQVMNDVGPKLERSRAGLDGSGEAVGRPALGEPTPGETTGFVPRALSPLDSVSDSFGGPGAGGSDAAKKIKQAAGLINSAANDMAKGGGGQGQGGPSPPPFAGNAGAGFNPGRR